MGTWLSAVIYDVIHSSLAIERCDWLGILCLRLVFVALCACIFCPFKAAKLI